MKKNIGGGINDLIDRSLPKGHNISTETYIKNLDHYYKDHLNKSTKVYPHIYDILNLLQKKGYSYGCNYQTKDTHLL